jgi:DNA end-binding protein Ku
MRAIWKGALSFGLVNIPIKLYSATEQKNLSLDMLDKNDLGRIRYKRVNEKTDKEVDWSDIVKGYKFNDKYIILADEDFEKANVKKNKAIEIKEFVEEDEIESIYYEKPYFLEPEPGGKKAYSLLREALRKTDKVGISTFVLRNKESLAVVKPYKNGLVLNTIRFAHEVRGLENLDFPSQQEVDPREMEMALSLINQYSKQFDISEYKDTYTEELFNIIEEKAEGGFPKEARKVEFQATKADDLMAQLKASLEQTEH